MSERLETVIIVGFEGKYTQVLARRVRSMGVYCEVVPSSHAGLDTANVKAALLCGGDAAALRAANPALADALAAVPAMALDTALCQEQLEHTEDAPAVRKFLLESCGLRGGWSMKNYAGQAVEAVRAQVGDGKVLLALSGGVDSSVVAALLDRAVGKNLICIFVDHGLMRKNEGDEIEAVFGGRELSFIRVNAQERFLGKLAGVSDPETKRKIIGEEFVRVFEEEAKKIGAVDFLAQGTIYPDIIESGVGAALVKSHHNVGGLPEHVDFKALVEPLKMLFKDEVRALGAALGLPDSLVLRQPFPGPGLAIRVIGDITAEKLDILRDADFIFREEIERAGLHREIGQYFAVITNMRSVGVRNGERTYDYTLALRAMLTSDFMSGAPARIPYDVLELVVGRIIGEVRGIGRVVYDVTGKPPSTIEWE